MADNRVRYLTQSHMRLLTRILEDDFDPDYVAEFMLTCR